MPVVPCPEIDRLVDDAAAGRPGAAERLDAHAAACAACLAEAEALDGAPNDDLGDALACLRDEACPPDVLAAVFAEVGAIKAPRLAADRAALPTSRPARRRVWAGVLAAAALVALATLWPRPEAPAPLVAETIRPETPALETPARTLPDETQPAEATPVETPRIEAPRVEAPTPRAAPAARRPAPRRSPRRLAAPRRAAPQPDASDPTDAPDVAEAPTPADTATARQDLLLALRIVARAQQSADAAVQTEMQRVSSALEPAQLLQ